MKGSQGLGVWIAIGVGIGTALGVALNNYGLGIGMGIAIGVAIGVGQMAGGKKEDEVVKDEDANILDENAPGESEDSDQPKSTD